MLNSFRRLLENYVLNIPLLTWILLGFLTTFFVFFIIPVFLGPSLTMKFTAYVPIFNPIGNDFRQIVSSSSTWFRFGTVPTTLYPPFTLIFFTPFTFVSYEIGYKILIGIILVCYLLTTLIIPQLINQNKGIAAFTLLIAITGLVSYGFQFELEQGQWNLIAFFFSVASIYIFHYRPRYRWLAYLLFSISVQLKLYPAIFVFTLIDDFSDWKNNVRRIAALGVFNVLALFIFGPSPILNTIDSLNKNSYHNSSLFNLSIASFTPLLLGKGILPHKRIIMWVLSTGWIFQASFFALFSFCFLVICFQSYKRKAIGFNPYIFLACVVGACIIPSISFDYKLSMLPASIAISMPEILLAKDGKNKALLIPLAFVFSLVYSSMLFSYIHKPKVLQSNFPALMLILVICAVLSSIKSQEPIHNSVVDS